MTTISNSRGNYWVIPEDEAADIYLFAAIVDLERVAGKFGGTVWVNGPIEIACPILPLDDLIIDFGNSTVTLLADISFLVFVSCSNARIKNARVTPKPKLDQLAPLIHFIADETGSNTFNRIENIVFHQDEDNEEVRPDHECPDLQEGEVCRYPPDDYICIYLENRGASFPVRTENNVFSNIVCRGCGIGILIEQTSANSVGDRFNHFKDIYFADGFDTMIEFRPHDDSTDLPSHNLFTHVKGQADSELSRRGVYNICGIANHFDHVLVWDWTHDDCPDWHISPRAVRTYICAHSIRTLYNAGSETLIAGAQPNNDISYLFALPWLFWPCDLYTDPTRKYAKIAEPPIIGGYNDVTCAAWAGLEIPLPDGQVVGPSSLQPLLCDNNTETETERV